MKMVTVNISLPPEMEAYARLEAARDCGNLSVFFREMVRERMRKQIESDLTVLASAIDCAPSGPSEAEVGRILAAQRRARSKLRARG